MTEPELRKLLAIIAADEGASLPRVAKKMAWAQSQLRRAIAIIGSQGNSASLGLLEERGSEPSRLYLTAAGRSYLGQYHGT